MDDRMDRGSGACGNRPGAWPAPSLARCASMSQTTAQQRYRQTERGKQQHREAERRRQARLRGEDVPLRQQNGEKTHCSACSLPYDEANTAYAVDGSRRCRNCHNNGVKAAYAADPETGRARSRVKNAKHGGKYNRRKREQRAVDPEPLRTAEKARYEDSPRKRNSIKYNRHGITEDEWLAMLEAQGGRCYLCGNDLGDETKRIHLDHDHRCCPTGRSCPKCRRGVACSRCNVIAGFARDNPELLRVIADNLEMAVRVVTARLEEGDSCRI